MAEKTIKLVRKQQTHRVELQTLEDIQRGNEVSGKLQIIWN
jgi:hypothetical protein